MFVLEPARAQAAEALQLEGVLSDLVNQTYALTPRRDRPDVASRPSPDADPCAYTLTSASNPFGVLSPSPGVARAS
jgi:hypothetical protein